MNKNKGFTRQNFSLRNLGGFTLIEMLVVIAVIGILAAAVLSALGPARNKAKDARIISDINQVRAVAETLYVNGIYNFTGASDSNFASLKTDITAQNGTLTIDKTSDNQQYRAYSNLSSGYYCINSAGDANQSLTGTAPAGAVPACK